MENIKTFEGFFDFLKRNKETDPKKIEIIKLCKQYGIEKYTINDDYSIDVDGSVELSHKRLTKIPVKFNIVNGYFACNGNSLENLENSPRRVMGNFFCINQYNNSLKSLKGAPEYVAYNFDCHDNEALTEFYFPEIGYGLNLEYTKIYTIQDIDFRFEVCNLRNTPIWSVLKTFIPIRSGDERFIVSSHIDKLELFKDFDIVRESEDGSYEFLCYRFILFIQEIGVKSFSEEYGVDDFKRSNITKEISKHYKIV